MLRFTFWCLLTVFLVCVFATQVSFHSSHVEWQPGALGDNDLEDWSLDTSPHPNSTDHLVFETVHSLLQRWPNTRMRNGHAIVPGIIPKGTLLYHGTTSNVFPTMHEWFATDPEHSYLFCGISVEAECWLFTIATTRPLKVVYFDGSSAAKLQDGALDTQDLLLWGEPRGGTAKEDMQRIEDICKWGGKYKVDAFVSEVMLCDPTSGVRVISSSNLASPLTQWPQKTLLEVSAFEIMNAAAWHNRLPGETRVHLNLAGLVTFYDTQLAPSLVPIRAGQERWDHRVQGISSEDLSATRTRLEEVLTRQEGLSSGIDWASLIQVIVDRYAERLDSVQYLLSAPATNPDDVLDLANKTQTQLRTELDWATPVFRLCATTHTCSMDSELSFMTDSEKLVLQAVRGTTREICRVVTKMWVAGVHAGIDPLLNTKEHFDVAKVAHLRNAWLEDLNHLITWLDWSEWVKCNPACDREEVCYLPTWPVGFPGGDKLGYVSTIFPPITEEWIRPQPKCIRRVAPYGF
ncbi:hypothetical protein L210DRAFT_3518810 [Boletus edulis BED1]|uniref:Transmembrane protein n=1 Tax=Boletus edulis BED1 TaxID=1328754 RepID=A0AAD4CA16_BOLED|nr:hypothetical protein L210DRAFT_3518810 [Boletus edulis BED1]